MGHKLTDGKAFNATAPDSTVINFGDLYRIGGWNGIAMSAKDATQTDRVLALEASECIWKVKFPSGLNPAVGAYVYWATLDNTTFQKGDTNLQATPATAGDRPAGKVLVAKNANGYAGIRVLN